MELTTVKDASYIVAVAGLGIGMLCDIFKTLPEAEQFATNAIKQGAITAIVAKVIKIAV